MKKYKAILHDWDDTITDSFKTYSKWYVDFAKNYNLKIPDSEDVKPYWGQNVPKIINGVWPELTADKIDVMFSNYSPKSHYMPNVFEGVEDLFEKLNSSGIGLGIISSGIGNIIKGTYKHHFGENNYHLFIHTQEDTLPYHKPNPKVFDKSLKRLSKEGINESDVLYVGDHTLDYVAAKNRGLDFAAVLTGVTHRDEFLDYGLDSEWVLESFLDVEDLVLH